jgi:uncharacterized protein (TIGR03437 family)
MSAAWRLLAMLPFVPCLWPEGPRAIPAPAYSAESIVNAADNRAGFVASHTLITIYGTDLSYSTRAYGAADGSVLPTKLDGVQVVVGARSAYLLYVSPTQINCLIPQSLDASVTPPPTIEVWRDNVRGPRVPLKLQAFAPALFATADGFAIATHADGSLLTSEQPAQPGEAIVLYCLGLGQTNPALEPDRLAADAAQIVRKGQLEVRIAGSPVPRDRVFYAGLTPGTAGVYQINLYLPDDTPADPEIAIALGDLASKEGLRFHCTGPAPP